MALPANAEEVVARADGHGQRRRAADTSAFARNAQTMGKNTEKTLANALECHRHDDLEFSTNVSSKALRGVTLSGNYKVTVDRKVSVDEAKREARPDYTLEAPRLESERFVPSEGFRG